MHRFDMLWDLARRRTPEFLTDGAHASRPSRSARRMVPSYARVLRAATSGRDMQPGVAAPVGSARGQCLQVFQESRRMPVEILLRSASQ